MSPRARRAPAPRPIALWALDSEGQRLDLDPWDALALNAGRELAQTATDDRIAAYELEVDGAPSVVLPIALGSIAIMDNVTRRILPVRRGPTSQGPQPAWTDDVALLEESGVPTEGWTPIVDIVATWWLANGAPPTQEQCVEIFGYSDQGTFARAIKPIGWPVVKVIALGLLRRMYLRLRDQIDPVAGPTIDQARLRQQFEVIFDPAAF